MKKETAVKYPHSANLFQFCRKVLDHKFGGIRVIDQDVGQILGFDPADCSHWKKGKKNIRSIQAMKAIAKHLGLDERLVVDVASGEMADWEAFFEYTGYGEVSPDPKILEAAKKEFYRKHSSNWSKDKEQEFRQEFEINEPAINRTVRMVHEAISFNEAPLYLPEIMNAFPEISMRAVEGDPSKAEDAIRVEEGENGRLLIEYPLDVKMRPYVRYQISRCIARYFMKREKILLISENTKHADYINNVQINLFATKLLTPAYLIRKELNTIEPGKDIVAQLADIFWTSKTYMNGRLKEILEKFSEV